jgi:hypothetical protein
MKNTQDELIDAIVPPFDGEVRNDRLDRYKYTWWSWHPNYPYWAKSCWGGNTIEAAHATLKGPMSSSMQYYHNKLIREEVILTEIEDAPCERLDIWAKIAEQKKEQALLEGK